MAMVEQTTRPSDILAWEVEKRYSRSIEILKQGQNLKAGTVLGKVTATEEVTQLDPAATDGSEVAYGVLLADVDASNSSLPCVVAVRTAIVVGKNLIFDSSLTSDQKAAALNQLEEKGILIK